MLISSHQLAEVQQLATHAVVLHRGRLVTAGPLTELLGDQHIHRFAVDDPATAASLLRSRRDVQKVSVEGGLLTVAADAPSGDLTRALVTAGIGVTSVEPVTRSLEEAFLTMVEDTHAAR